jgi:hypothetical protein
MARGGTASYSTLIRIALLHDVPSTTIHEGSVNATVRRVRCRTLVVFIHAILHSAGPHVASMSQILTEDLTYSHQK